MQEAKPEPPLGFKRLLAAGDGIWLHSKWDRRRHRLSFEASAVEISRISIPSRIAAWRLARPGNHGRKPVQDVTLSLLQVKSYKIKRRGVTAFPNQRCMIVVAFLKHMDFSHL